MDNERLSDLLVIAVEKETASLIDLNQAIDMFGAMKTRKILSYCLASNFVNNTLL